MRRTYLQGGEEDKKWREERAEGEIEEQLHLFLLDLCDYLTDYVTHL